MGTYGYLDKKYERGGIVSEETDVFAIGMIMRILLMGLYRAHHWLYDEEEEEDAKEEGDGEGNDDDDTNDYATMSKINDLERKFQSRLLKFMEEGRMDKIVDPEMVETMDEVSEQELCHQMKAFGMLSLRCMSHKGEEVPKMVEVAKVLKNIQRSLRNDSSSSLSDETQFNSALDISSSVVFSNKS